MSTRAAWLAPVVLSALLIGCGKDEAQVLAQARTQLAQKDSAGAEKNLKAVLQRNPKSGEARLMLAELYAGRGKMAEAQAEYERALEARVPQTKVLPQLARIMLGTNQPRQLLDQWGTVTLDDPAQDADLQASLAGARFAVGETLPARERLDQIVAKHPDLAYARLMQARMAQRMNRPDEALALVTASLAKFPQDAQMWTLQGDLLGNGDAAERAKAREAFGKAIALAPEGLGPYGSLIALALREGDIPAAQAAFDRLKQKSPQGMQTVFYDAQLSYSKRDFKRARAAYQALLGAAPNAPSYLVGAAETELQLGEAGQAAQYAGKALTIAPDNALAKRMLAQALLRQGQAARAAEVLEPLVQDPKAPAEVVALGAEIQKALGKDAAAQALLQRVAAMNPTDARLRTAAVAAGLSSANPEPAYRALAEIARTDPGISAETAMLQARLQARAWDRALEVVAAIDRKMPGRGYPKMLRAQVLAAKGDEAGARAALSEATKAEPDLLAPVLALARLDAAEGKPQVGRDRLLELQKRRPRDAKVLQALAELDLASGRPLPEILKLLDDAVKLEPADPDVRRAQLDVLMRNGDLRTALSAAQTAVEAVPRDPELMARLAQIQAAAGDRDQALATYGKIASIQPGSTIADMGMADVYMQEGKFREAGRHVDELLARDPKNAQAAGLAVLIGMAQKDYPAALERARHLQKQRPDDALGWALEGEVAAAQQQWPQALAALRTAVTKPQPGRAPIKLLATLNAQGDRTGAEAFTVQWLKDHPRDAEFMFYVAETARQANQPTVAQRWYEQLLAVAPNHAPAMNNLAMVLLAQKKPAVAMAQQAVDRLPYNTNALDTLAQALAADGKVDKAIEVENRALALGPKDPALRLQMAKLQMQAGNKSAARAELKKLAEGELKLNAEQKAELTRLTLAAQG